MSRADTLGTAVFPLLLATLLLAAIGCGRSASGGAPRRIVPTFTRDVAPVVFERCSPCHRPGQQAPFALLTYEDVRMRAAQIATVTRTRAMPPWLPEPGYGEFADDRRLRDDEIELVDRWVRAGAIEGDAADLPRTPQWAEGWRLGTPDLIVEMKEPFTLPGGGADVFRNFVLPVELSSGRYVRAVEFHPGNPRIVHHAVINVDPTRASRRLDEEDPRPGFDGMSVEASRGPDGRFLGWTPGKVPTVEPPGMAWRLERGSDLIVQLHLLPTGTPETIRASVGLFFTDAPPTATPFLLKLGSKTNEIRADDKAYTINDRYVLPVDVDALGVYPHAHYLATDMRGSARLPDGTTRWLIRIKAWDFHKQDQYRYAAPIFLPRGTVVTMQYTYDNSDDNRHNPHHPPERVIYGPRSSDEMGDLWIQVRPRQPADAAVLARDAAERDARGNIAAAELMVRRAPGDAGHHNFLGASYLQIGRLADGIGQLEEAIRLRPRYAEAHNNLGGALLSQGRLADAIGHFRQAIAANPRYDRVHFNLANALSAADRHNEAAAEFRRALAINPEFAEAHNNLGVLLGGQRRFDEAVQHFEQALAVNPQYADAHNNLGLALGSLGRKADAIAHFRRALEIRPDYADARSNLSLVEIGR